jgi:hypothetical protein
MESRDNRAGVRRRRGSEGRRRGRVGDLRGDGANNIATEWIDAGWATEVKGGSAVGGKATPRKKPT